MLGVPSIAIRLIIRSNHWNSIGEPLKNGCPSDSRAGNISKTLENRGKDQ